MKKLISVLCALALILSCVSFADTVSGEMARVTETVKQTLGIEDIYTDFSGWADGGFWGLDWYGNDRSVDVTCDSEGTIYSYYSYEYAREDSFTARFPAIDADGINAAAAEFMDRVTGGDWGYEIKSASARLVRSAYDLEYVSGRLTLRGIPTDITFSLGVNALTGKVTHYSRSDAYSNYTSKAPAQAVIPAEEALEKLKSIYFMKPVYRVIKYGEMAVVVYVPDGANQAVSAIDGSIIDTDAGYVLYARESAAEAMDAKLANGLTAYELEGISVYDGVMTLEELDAALRAMPELKLTDEYSTVSAEYYVNDAKAYASISYRAGSKGDYIRKYANVRAEDGALMGLSSSSDRYTEPEEGDTCGYLGTAHAFLEKYYPSYAAQVMYTGDEVSSPLHGNDPVASFTFTRVYDDIPYEYNTVWVSVDSSDGSVCGFSANWDEGQEFTEVDKSALIGTQNARSAFIPDMTPVLVYKTVVDCSDDVRTCSLVLCWDFELDPSVYAVDGVTGAPVKYETKTNVTYSYENAGDMLHADEIITLGRFGIGLKDCGFTEKDTLTDEQFMRLLLQVKGIGTEDLTVREMRDRIRLSDGVTVAEGTITRAEMCRVLAYVNGYGKTVSLAGIFSLPAADWTVTAEDEKAALAVCYALDLISLDGENINASAPALTADAAHAIYVMLSR